MNPLEEHEPAISEEPEASVAADAQSGLAAAPEDGEQGPGTAAAPEDEETDPLAAAEAEVARWKDLALRSQADLDNYRKRMAREKADALRYANAEVIESLLPILDNFQFGLDAARAESEDSVIFQGMQMVLKQIDDFLTNHGVERVATAGQAFDPNLHEAVAHEHSDETPEGQILSEARGGYRLNDRLLRAPTVVVSKGPASA